MKYILIETREETNETFVWEYATEEAATENIKHMKIPELEPHLGERTIRLFKAEEIDIANIEGYSLDEIRKKSKEGDKG